MIQQFLEIGKLKQILIHQNKTYEALGGKGEKWSHGDFIVRTSLHIAYFGVDKLFPQRQQSSGENRIQVNA
jgi:hypothetical protein